MIILFLAISDAFTGSWQWLWAICELHLIPCVKITIFSRWHHCLILNFYISNIDQSRLELLKIKMYVHKILAICLRLRHNKLEYLLIPSLTYPTNISKLGRFHWSSIPRKHNIITINIPSNYRMQWSNLFILNFNESFRIYIAIVSTKMEAIYFLIFVQFLTYYFCLLFIEAIVREIYVD